MIFRTMMEADPELAEFNMLIGQCITAWSKVEERLFDICWHCLGSPKEQAAIVYYRTPTVDARLTLADELVKSVLPKPARKSGGHPHSSVKKWNKLEADLKSKLAIRRRIAHQPVRPNEASFGFDDSDAFKGSEFKLSWYELYVSENEDARGKELEPKTLIVTDLLDHGSAVMRLADGLKAFHDNELLAHAPKSAAPDPRHKSGSSKDSPAHPRSTKRRRQPES